MNAAAIHQQVVAKVVNAFLIFVFLGGTATAVWQVLLVSDAAEPPRPALFDHGLTTANVRAPKKWTNQYCGTCHPNEYRQWKASRHAISGLNISFERQCLDQESGRKQWCLNCHTPTNPGHNLLPTEEPAGLDQAFADKPHWLTNGVDCLTCHVRDGRVLVTHDTVKARKAHPIRMAPELAKAEFCAGCHQFAIKHPNLPDAFRGHLQQASFEEFLDFRTAGGFEYRCHECHIPDGDHSMPGGYSPRMLRKALALKLSVKRVPDEATVEVSVEVSAREVGHLVPGGEHFRYLTLQMDLVDAAGVSIESKSDPTQPANLESKRSPVSSSNRTEAKTVFSWPQVEPFQRTLGAYESGDPEAEPSRDTRLLPGESRQFRYLIAIDPVRTKFPIEARAVLRYHVLHESLAERLELVKDTMPSVVYTEQAILTASGEQ